MKLRPAIVTGLLAGLLGGCGGGSSQPVPIKTPVGTPKGNPVTQNIGSSGGSLTSADGKVTLTVPAGALSANTDITLEGLSNTAPDGIGDGVRLSLNGSFAQPVTLTLKYDPATPLQVEGGLGVAVQLTDGSWGAVRSPSLDTTAKTISIKTAFPVQALSASRVRGSAGFSQTDIGLFEMLSIDPTQATLKVSQQQQLKVIARISETPPCPPAGGDEDLLCPLPVLRADLIPNQNKLGSFTWGASAGTVAPLQMGATFTAPATIPPANPVAVSAKFQPNAQSPLRAFMLVSNITITGQGGKWSGNFSGTYPFFTFEGQVEWSLDESGPNVPLIETYKPSGGSLTYRYTGPAVGCTVTPSTQPLTANDGTLTIDYTGAKTAFEVQLSKGGVGVFKTHRFQGWDVENPHIRLVLADLAWWATDVLNCGCVFRLSTQ